MSEADPEVASPEAEVEAEGEGGEQETADKSGAEQEQKETADANADKGGEDEDGGGDDAVEEGADEGEDDEEDLDQIVTAVVPRLDDLVVKCLAENYDVYPALDRIPPEYLDNVVALLDPSQIVFTVATKFIESEKFWKRLCQERWPICELANHGMSWKRMYVERHLWSLFEAYYPSNHGQNFEKLMTEVNAGKSFVHTVTIQQLLSHLDLSDILTNFPHLTTLNLKYGARKLGMDYDKSLFGMHLKDAMMLAKLFASSRSLTRVCLNENLLGDESVHIICSGLARNDTILQLDLSHNKIGDVGAKRISRVLRGMSVLTELDLGDNNIHSEGGQELGNALANNSTLRSFSMKLNPIGDQAGIKIMEALQTNTSLTSLNMCGTSLTPDAGSHLTDLISQNKSLTHLDFSCNDFTPDDGTAIKGALVSNSALLSMDLRRNKIEDDALKELSNVLNTRYAEDKRRRRKLYQQGWDEAL
mmetsp:Transcript_11911/g.22708  ORF Transcript_11911/g.22708 Transcript_11911/m.22708 type:complete len:475 (+) Transcript_11911:23-1447(+)|eukprot:CAMPEP_0175165556 /NCGR_PEP_ID=MMETSP0087-20121206/27156_1 /TAXON_ID=136419 /ORGANISM="Unknown Unknown, Strain D1" /LENGTH=474 /DNA_ID=CAMNT_0016454955 /DNA_START=2232 /DNA_END=3656 /DNA_ORIENTATION=+